MVRFSERCGLAMFALKGVMGEVVSKKGPSVDKKRPGHEISEEDVEEHAKARRRMD